MIHSMTAPDEAFGAASISTEGQCFMVNGGAFTMKHPTPTPQPAFFFSPEPFLKSLLKQTAIDGMQQEN